MAYAWKCKLLLVALLLWGCASLVEKRCNSEFAQESGYLDATQGDLSAPGKALGNVCTESAVYSLGAYQQDYDAGFAKRQLEVCQRDRAIRLGKLDADALDLTQDHLGQFKICDSQMTEAYLKTYQDHFCKKTTFSNLGEGDGQTLTPSQMETLSSLCSPQTRRNLQSSYQAGYLLGSKKACSITDLYIKGRSDFTAGFPMEAFIGKMGNCPEENRNEALNAYTRGYQEAQTAYQQERLVEIEMQRLKAEKQFLEQQESKPSGR